ncbi:MAG: redoxin family protein [Anaerolineae bacterium]|nr:redoxin family protein [Anaerolineae bacterium]
MIPFAFTRFRRFCWRALLAGALITLIMGLIAARPTAAQGPDATEIEALALRVHAQNLRTHSFTFWIGGNLGDPANAPPYAPLGEPLTNWTLRGFAGDDDVSFEDVTRPMLLNFWASWCPPCRAEFPHLISVALAPDEHAFDVLFINVSDEERDAMEYLAQHTPDIYTVIDEGNRLSQRVSANSIPTSILIDTDGTALAIHIGILTPTLSDFLDAVAQAPGVGTFVAADHEDVSLAADLLPVDATAAAPVPFNEQVRGILTAADLQHVYRFEGQAGDMIGITMQADRGRGSELDAYLVLMTADGERLAENDDAADFSQDSALEVTLPADGVYLVVATRFLEADGFGDGDYILQINRTPAGESAAPPIQGPGQDPNQDDSNPNHLSYGETVQGRISGNDPRQLYSFEGRAGDVITLTVSHNPNGAPLRIEVKDSHVHRLAVSEESIDGAGALADLELPEDGRYHVTVMRARGDDTEYMTFTLTLAAAGYESGSVDLPPGDMTLAYGDTAAGTISNEQPEQRWMFAGQQGDVIAVVMARDDDADGSLDGYLQLVGPDGGVLVEVDDSPDNVMPTLTGYVLPEDGIYTLVATRFGFANGFSTGAYTLALTQTGSAATGPAVPDGAGQRWIDPANLPPGTRWITYNEPATGTISGDHFEDWYTFRGRAGDVITLRLVAEAPGDLDTFLILTDRAGYELAINDDQDETNHDAAISDFELPIDGVYMVRATRYGFENGPSSGSYTLLIETDAEPVGLGSEDAIPLPDGELVTGELSFDTPLDRYTFEASAGEQVTISMLYTKGGIAAGLMLRGPDGEELGSGSPWGVTGPEIRLNRVLIPADGTYTLDVRLDNLNTTGGYRLLMLRSPAPEVVPGAFVPAAGPDIELVLVWAGSADLDLIAYAPFIETIPPVNWQWISANNNCVDLAPAPLEQRTVPATTAVSGRYTVSIRYSYDCGGMGQPVPFTLAIVINGEVVDLINGTLPREGDSYSTSFDYRR